MFFAMRNNSEKHPVPVTPDGNLMDVNITHLLNALSPIRWADAGIYTEKSDTQSSKEFILIDFMEIGRLNDTREEQR